MLQKTMKASTALTPVVPVKSSAELSAEHDRLIAERDFAASEWDRLKEGEPAAGRAGVDDLLRHRDKMSRVAARRDGAGYRAEETARLRDEAIEREREEERRARYDAVVAKRDAVRRKLAARYYDLAAELRDLLTEEQSAQRDTMKVNRDLPTGCEPLDHIEAPLRWVPAELDREEEVEVNRPILSEGMNRLNVGEGPPTQKVKEKRIIKGARAIMPPPLWLNFQAAEFKAGDADFVVPGTGFHQRNSGMMD